MRDQMIEAIDKGQVTVKENLQRAVLHSLSVALRSVIGIIDLRLALLRNFSQLPFIFGDSPCVFYNRYLYSVPYVGGLGIQSPGLMIFMPLDPVTQLMLYDPATYQTSDARAFVNVTENSDVSQLNALQLHSAKSAVYFADRKSAEYLVELLKAHRPLFKESYNEFRQWSPGEILIDGKPNETEAVQTGETQLPIQVDLSFINTEPVAPDENPRRPRSPELRDELFAIFESDESDDAITDATDDPAD
jgi:Protein of unknown function (DUF4238)